jgi:hypothetical protein
MLYRSLWYLGRMKELSKRLPQVLRESDEHNDTYAITNFRTGPAVQLALATDDLAEAEALFQAGTRHLPPGVFLVQHYFATIAECQIELYRGNARSAYDILNHASTPLRRSLLLRIQPTRIVWLEHRARCAVALSVGKDRSEAEPLLEEAEQSARKLDQQGVLWAEASAQMIRGAIAARRGELDTALEQLEHSTQSFTQTDMKLFAAATRRAHGALLGGDEGQQLISEADQSLAAQGVQSPRHMSRILGVSFPGLAE